MMACLLKASWCWNQHAVFSQRVLGWSQFMVQYEMLEHLPCSNHGSTNSILLQTCRIHSKHKSGRGLWRKRRDTEMRLRPLFDQTAIALCSCRCCLHDHAIMVVLVHPMIPLTWSRSRYTLTRYAVKIICSNFNFGKGVAEDEQKTCQRALWAIYIEVFVGIGKHLRERVAKGEFLGNFILHSPL